MNIMPSDLDSDFLRKMTNKEFRNRDDFPYVPVTSLASIIRVEAYSLRKRLERGIVLSDYELSELVKFLTELEEKTDIVTRKRFTKDYAMKCRLTRHSDETERARKVRCKALKNFSMEELLKEIRDRGFRVTVSIGVNDE